MCLVTVTKDCSEGELQRAATKSAKEAAAATTGRDPSEDSAGDGGEGRSDEDEGRVRAKSRSRRSDEHRGTIEPV